MIETAIKEDLILDKKLIIPKNKLDAIRIMNELHPVVGGQPTHEKDQPNDNNPILDLACTLANIHASGVGEHADLRQIQNEPPSFFYGEGFISGISSLKGNGILAMFGHWRDGSGNYAIKQFYYTDKEISYRNALSEDKWGAWIDVLTSNSQLDYNKLLNVPITSTLSDDKNKIASIFSVNEVNRKAVSAQKTANTGVANAKVADGKAVAAQNTANTAVTNAKTADGKAVAAQNTANTAVANAKTADDKAIKAQSTADRKRDLSNNNFTGRISTEDGMYVGSGDDRIIYHKTEANIPYIYSYDTKLGYAFKTPGDQAAVSETAALGAAQWTDWRSSTHPTGNDSRVGEAISLTYAFATVPSNSVVCKAESKRFGLDDSRSRVLYRRVIRAGN